MNILHIISDQHHAGKHGDETAAIGKLHLPNDPYEWLVRMRAAIKLAARFATGQSKFK